MFESVTFTNFASCVGKSCGIEPVIAHKKSPEDIYEESTQRELHGQKKLAFAFAIPGKTGSILKVCFRHRNIAPIFLPFGLFD